NSTALGNDAIVIHSDQMILGNNSVDVGIGLSNDPTGPRSKLEIKSASTGVSGLQFTNLTSSYSPSLSSPKFLTVESDGKVVLKNEAGNVSACGTAASNYIPVSTSGTDICKSIMYEN